jgi:multidrug efflux pump subunit AcrA (membrane-fusion protein)
VELERHHGVPAVPLTALVPRHGDASGRVAVVVVGEDLRARQVPIEVGATDGTWTEVRSGVAIGTPVISDGAYALPEGTRVSIAPPSRGDGGSRSEP